MGERNMQPTCRRHVKHGDVTLTKQVDVSLNEHKIEQRRQDIRCIVKLQQMLHNIPPILCSHVILWQHLYLVIYVQPVLPYNNMGTEHHRNIVQHLLQPNKAPIL